MSKCYWVERREQRKWPWTKWARRLLVAVSVFSVCGGVTKSLRGKWFWGSDFANRQLIPAQSSADLKLTVCSVHLQDTYEETLVHLHNARLRQSTHSPPRSALPDTLAVTQGAFMHVPPRHKSGSLRPYPKNNIYHYQVCVFQTVRKILVTRKLLSSNVQRNSCEHLHLQWWGDLKWAPCASPVLALWKLFVYPRQHASQRCNFSILVNTSALQRCSSFGCETQSTRRDLEIKAI